MNHKEFNDLFLGTFEQPKQSELLTQFYRAYFEWVNNGAPEQNPFSRYHGLCGALRQWANRNAQLEYPKLKDELLAQFMKETTSFLHPFHTFAQEYNREVDRGEAHLNLDRIKWVKDRAQQ
jgi:hypothetical protein